ncbi:MAG: hypothetical protein LBB05_02905 [Puniceicoccales bacterium]|nr:hypothetical protein [Puniceicoccales bacterium]
MFDHKFAIQCTCCNYSLGVYPWTLYDGTWDEEAGLYGSKGDYVVFCDGHVTWFDGSKPAKFLKWDQSGYTSKIYEAVPLSNPELRIGCAGWAAYRGKNPLLITFMELRPEGPKPPARGFAAGRPDFSAK